jgi:hypothetical protein
MNHPVDDDPIMASAIGRCSNNWTHLESKFAWIFTHLTKMDYAVAVTVFSFFKATRTQRDVLKKIAKIAPFMTDDLQRSLSAALKKYLALAEERNELLHNPIGRSVENQVYIMLRRPDPKTGEVPYLTKPILPEEIDSLSAKIVSLSHELIQLDQAISEAIWSMAMKTSSTASE